MPMHARRLLELLTDPTTALPPRDGPSPPAELPALLRRPVPKPIGGPWPGRIVRPGWRPVRSPQEAQQAVNVMLPLSVRWPEDAPTGPLGWTELFIPRASKAT